MRTLQWGKTQSSDSLSLCALPLGGLRLTSQHILLFSDIPVGHHDAHLRAVEVDERVAVVVVHRGQCGRQQRVRLALGWWWRGISYEFIAVPAAGALHRGALAKLHAAAGFWAGDEWTAHNLVMSASHHLAREQGAARAPVREDDKVYVSVT